MQNNKSPSSSNFIKEIIRQDVESGRHNGRVTTRFPPEPNGYLHIGHAKSICLNFALAREFGGKCNLRFDDTNPAKEETEYVNSIKHDIRWLGFDWEDREYYASDYFDQLYEWAVQLVKNGSAYVDSLSEEEIRKYRGDYYTKAKASPYRDRTPEENLDLLERMKAGEFQDGEHVLRAKIDMESSNMNMRDPVMYRIKHAAHHRTGDRWCIYPMYDFAHGQSDAVEKITHSLCTLEFENHRPLYDWFVQALKIKNPPHQYEFARLNLTYTVMSKRRLLELVQKKKVSGWDDPRMPTISGMRRRGYPAAAIRKFCERIGVSKADNMVDVALLEHCVREQLNETAPRVMAVLNPLKVVILNYPENETEEFEGPLHPEDASMGSRKLPFSREIYVERDDFREDAPRKWHRLAPGKEVRLRYACLVKCVDVKKDPDTGEVMELHCTWDPESRGGKSPDGRKVRGTLHWVSAHHALKAEVRLYDRLFTVPNPMYAKEGKSWEDFINPHSIEVVTDCALEPYLSQIDPGTRIQFERIGYFCADSDECTKDTLVFNRTVQLRDTWAKIERQQTKSTPDSSGRHGDLPLLQNETNEINIQDFAKLDIRVAEIKEAGLVEGADRLIFVKADIGGGRILNIFSGIRKSYPDPSVLVGKKVAVLANLKPRKMKFGVSEGMLLTGGEKDDALSVAFFDETAVIGERIS